MDQFDATGKNGQTDSKDVNQELDDLLANPFSDPFASSSFTGLSLSIASDKACLTFGFLSMSFFRLNEK